MLPGTDWASLYDAVKDECRSGLWAQGVGLARNGAVSASGEGGGGTWSFRVGAAATVTLHPGDAEWDCDCGSRIDPCAHVAAAAIAVRQNPDAVFAAAAARRHVRYELSIAGDAITLQRSLATPDGAAEPLGDLGASGATPSATDVVLDRLLRDTRTRAIAAASFAPFLRALADAEDVHLAGDPVRVSRDPAFPKARVQDGADGGVEVVVTADPEVAAVVASGIVRTGDTLRPMGVTGRYGARWERLPARRTYAPAAFAEVVGRVLPELEREIDVEVATTRLPGRTGATPPWVRFNLETVEQAIELRPELVYGDPPVARVEAGRLVHLRGAVPRRDEAAEHRLELRLRDDLHLALGRRVRLAGADAARLLSGIRTFDDGRPPAARARTTDVALTPRLVGAGADAAVVFEAPDGTQRATAEAVVGAWRDGLSLVPLGGGFGAVPSGWLAKHGHLVTELLSAREAGGGRVPRAAMPLVAEVCEAFDQPPPFDAGRLTALLEAGAVDVPADFTGTLRPYQRDGVAWLIARRDADLGAVLADDMGLGKTIQALCALRGRTLVVCPRSVIHNWQAEIARFRPSLRVALYHGPRREPCDADVTITTYATLRNDADVLVATRWDTVVLDEAQAIKNPDSQTARAAYALDAGFRLSLSGTPVENRLDELWSQMHFANRGLLGGRRDFAERYETPVADGDARAAERLRRRIGPFVLRRLKREVAQDLPPRTDAVLTCELEPSERAVYDAVRAAARADVARRLGDGGNVLAALEALLRLRQAACHVGLVPGHEAATSSKVEALLDALGDAVADGHKALVFSQWTSLLDRVEPHLRGNAIPFTRLDGSTRDRAGVVDAFQRADGPPVMLVSLTAGGTGLNLTAADHVFLLDPWWNPAVEDQAADRAHRIGQDRPVLVYRMVAKDTVEERVLALQAQKRGVAEAALGSGSAGGALTRDDILALLD
ncbi:MAG: DEAD/DEAH box helicase [bacterium]|nr:DEAD/DEAH box helicase [bacterium]